MRKTNKMLKKTICLSGCFVLGLVLLTGCKKDDAGNAAATPTVAAEATVAPTAAPTVATADPLALTTGIFHNKFTAEGHGDYEGYFHFYDNGIFYLSLYNDRMSLAGHYEVIDQEAEYMPDPDKADEKAKATQVIKLTNLDGSDFETLAFANDTVYNLASYYNKNFEHVADSDHQASDEKGIAVADYMLGEDTYSAVSIKHNGTFADTVTGMVEGTWTVDGSVYSLTNTETGKTYTMTVSADGATAEYVGEDGTTQTLNKAVAAAEPTAAAAQ